MGIKTDLNRFPYFDDYQEDKDFYQILFKPKVAVQARELNQLQTIQKVQLERIADNIFKRGTILAGVNFNFFNPYPYIKLADFEIDGVSVVNPVDYVGAIVEDEVTGLKAFVTNYADGFEASAPDLKTIYVKYINSGTSGNTNAFTAGNTVTIREGDFTLWRVNVEAGGQGFSNNDTVVIQPSLLVNVHSGALSNSDVLVHADTGARLEITEVDENEVPGRVVLHVKPVNDDLLSGNSLAWSFDIYDSVTNEASSVSATIEAIYGEGASGFIRTDALGNIREVPIRARGEGYKYTPSVSVFSSNSSATVGSVALRAQNYIAKILIPSVPGAVGNGYAFGVDEGQIYDHGHALRVAPQVVLVEKYSQTPNNVVAGFLTTEEIIDHNLDDSLLDNALGFKNHTAPGADRLRMTPKLVILNKDNAEANSDFLVLVEWNNGNPVKQNRATQYNRLGDQMAQDLYDQSGNFVLDAFQVTTDSPLDANLESHYYSVIVDPGQAYINGRKRQTLANYRIDLTKGTDTKISNNSISLNYGNYIRIKDVGGSFDCASGSIVKLYNQPKQFISNSANYSTGNTTPKGTQIGTARVRSFELENGQPGLADTTYRLYIFDLKLNAGQKFESVRSCFMDNVDYDAIGDVILEYNGTSNTNVAVIKEPNTNSLLFPTGTESLKNSNQSSYQYRSTVKSNTVISNGTLTISLADGSEFFPYGINRDLSSAEMRELVVVPVQDDLVAANAIPGTVSVNTSSNVVNGSGTAFFDHFKAGDPVMVSNGSFDSIRIVTAVNASNQLKLDAAPSFANSSATIRRAYPVNSVIPFGTRDGLTANVDISGQSVTLQFRHANGTPMQFNFANSHLETKVTFNAERRNVTSATKTAVRNRYVKIRCATSAGKAIGPWCLGVPDIFRLRAVYKGNDANVSVSSADVTKDFYIDHNQNANYMGLGYLYLNPQASYRPAAGDYLLVCFDYFTRDNSGYYDTKSYLRTSNTEQIQSIDSMSFADLSQQVAASSWEVPQVFTTDNKYFDLLNTFDFRPTVDATASPTSNAATAPINPAETITFSSMSKFPKPNASMTTNQEQYLGRIDDIYIGESGNIYALKGIPDVNPRRRLQSNHPKDSLRLQTLNIPPYPNATEVMKPTVHRVMDTKVHNEKVSGVRLKQHKIEPIVTSTNLQTSQPMVYTMEDIANLERRIISLEYQAQLSMSETQMTNKNIPSSADRSVNRFKFGFFADDFSTSLYSDVANPQYAASLENEGDLDYGFSGNPMDSSSVGSDKASPVGTGIAQPTQIIQKSTNRITPLKFIWSMKHIAENLYFKDEAILGQDDVTEPAPVIVKPNTPPPPPPDPCVVQVSNTAALTPGFAYITAINKPTSPVYTEEVAGQVTVYFNVYGGADTLGARIEVLNKDGTVVASTKASSSTLSNLSAADKTFLSTNAVADTFHTGVSVVSYTNFERNANPSFDGYVRGSGKLTFVNKGQKYTVVTTSVDTNAITKVLTKYPSVYAVDKLVVNKPNCDPESPPRYVGTLSTGTLTMIQWSCSNQFRVNSTNYRAFVLNATGMKPNTIHKLYMDTTEWPHAVNLTQALLDSAKYGAVMRNSKNYTKLVNAGTINDQTLITSRQFKVNEVTQFLANARAALYDKDGNPTAATQLKSDASGKMRILVFFPIELAGWFSQDFNATAYGETKTGTSSNPYEFGFNAGKLKPTQGSSGYTSLELTNGSDSSAVRVFANRTPTKTLPNDSKGTI